MALTDDKKTDNLFKTEIMFKAIKDVTGISKKQILAKNRVKDVAIVRNIAGYMLHKDIGFTSTDSAKILNLDHSTVIYYSTMFETNYEHYKEYKDLYDMISEYFWSEFSNKENEKIDLQVKSLNTLIERLKRRADYLLTKNN